MHGVRNFVSPVQVIFKYLWVLLPINSKRAAYNYTQRFICKLSRLHFSASLFTSMNALTVSQP